MKNDLVSGRKSAPWIEWNALAIFGLPPNDDDDDNEDEEDDDDDDDEEPPVVREPDRED